MRLVNWIRAGFLTGLVVIVPFGLSLFFTYKVSLWIYSLVSAVPAMVLENSIYNYSFPDWVFKLISFSIGVFCTVFLVVLTGYTARNIIGNRLVSFVESIILTIPLVRTAYNASKQILKTLFFTAGSGEEQNRRVVIFEYPKEGVYAIGFLMNKMKPGQGHNILDETLVNIFLPTTPNPTSGFYVMVPESKVREIPMSVEHAFNVIISGGLAASKD